MRKLVIPLILLLGLIFLFLNKTELQEVVATFQRGNLVFLLVALIVQVVWTLNVAYSYKTLYRAVGIDERPLRLFLLVNAAFFVNVVAPTVGMGGVAVFAADAEKRGISSGRASVAGILVGLFDYLGFLCLLVWGLVVLIRRNNLNASALTASAILFFMASVLSFLVYLGMHSEAELARALAWIAHQLNRFFRLFIHKDYLSEERAYTFAHEVSTALGQLRHKPINLIKPLLLGLSSKLLLVLILLLVFIAFQVPFSTGTIIGGFSIGYLFHIVSPTPAGVGFVEGAMTIGLTSLNVHFGTATVITLAYRGITFWLPLLFGSFSLRWVGQKNRTAISNK